MQKSRLYLLQLLGIIMLIAGYFISDVPDSRSAMHFEISSTHVIRATQHGGNNGHSNTSDATYSSHEKSSHKGRTVKHFSFKVIIPRQSVEYHYEVPLQSITYVTPISESYFYLFSKEINPPPPKFC